MRQFSSTLKFINGFTLEPIDPYHLCGERYLEELLFMFVVDKIAHITVSQYSMGIDQVLLRMEQVFSEDLSLCVLVIEMALLLLPINVL